MMPEPYNVGTQQADSPNTRRITVRFPEYLFQILLAQVRENRLRHSPRWTASNEVVSAVRAKYVRLGLLKG